MLSSVREIHHYVVYADAQGATEGTLLLLQKSFKLKMTSAPTVSEK